ncbi:unnamed protein product [Dicrocoelium dendriticum]|nr:unnamed protein product [Dicrocoelium dendriticum]
MVTESDAALVVIEFYAEWCGPCTMIADDFENLKKSYPSVYFYRIDVDSFRYREAAKEYKVTRVPTFVVLKDRKVHHTIVGANINALKEAIDCCL